MLKGLDPLLSAELLHVLALMGHGDELVIADANFPAAANARRLIAMPGTDVPELARAVLSVFPLDTFVEKPLIRMAVDGDADSIPPVIFDVLAVAVAAGEGPAHFAVLERHAFYERARTAFAIVATGERRGYANVIMKKGVVSA
jgi:L-fucose mutarotase